MSVIHDSDWPVLEPPRDFAQRTTALLLDGAQATPASSGPGGIVRRRKRWPFVLLAATSLTATAWGTLHLGGRPSSEMPPPVARPRATEAVRSAPGQGWKSTPVEEPAPASPVEIIDAPEPAPATVRKPRKARLPSAAEPTPELPERRPFVAPRCECGPGGVICSCVE